MNPASFFFFFNLVSVARRLSLVAASRGYSLLQCAGFSLQRLLLLRNTGSRCIGFNSCSTRAQWLRHTGPRVRRLQQLWHMGLVALRHVGSSRTRDRTHVPGIGRRILNHCAAREVPESGFLHLLHPFLHRKALQSLT